MQLSSSFQSTTKFAGIAAVLLLLPVAVACGSQTATTPDPVAETMPSTTEGTAPTTETTAPTETAAIQTIVETAIANGSFNTLVAAVQAADLVDTLNGQGPFTVFAPTDEAFAALPAGVLDKLLLPENKAVLTQILTYHVVAGDVPASAVTTGPVASVEGANLDLTADAGQVTVNDAKVVQADVVASNGVIHVIDAVLLPPGLDPSTL